MNTLTDPVNVKPKKILSVFSLVMINVIAVDSLRTLAFGAKFGTGLIFFYLLCALLYFIPVGLVAAELATTWPKLGGIYVWVKEAFGARLGFLVVWLQWLYNVVWYPTILGLMASVVAYLVAPELADNNYYIFAVVIIGFWLSTFANLYGMFASSLLSTITSIIGTIIPMVVVIALGVWWFFTEDAINTVDWQLIPEVNSINDLALIITIVFGLMGLEMSAVHAAEVKNPKKDYPKALLISGAIILVTLILSSLTVALVVPEKELNIVLGVIQAFEFFFKFMGMPWLMPVFGLFIVIGAFGAVSTWIIGPTKGMLATAKDGYLPMFLARTNKYGAPTNILICQALIVTGLSACYVFLPGIEEAYLVLTELTAILALTMYVLFFISGIRLRYVRADVPRPFKIPFGNVGIWIVGTVGAITSFVVLIFGFIPPSQIMVTSTFNYQLILLLGCALACAPALFIHKLHRKVL